MSLPPPGAARLPELLAARDSDGRPRILEPGARGLVGAKPARFARWALDLLGYVQGDELSDLFPGTGVLGAVAVQGRLALQEGARMA